MAGQLDELKKLVGIATDSGLPAELRTNAIRSIGKVGTHDALLALLNLAGNENLTNRERELALKEAGGIIRSRH